MIPQAEITEWREHAPWANDADVEQDLVISRAIVDLSNIALLRERTAFRGGTPLHKIVLPPAARYSDDIDLTNTSNTAIGETFTAIRKALAWIDPKPRYSVGEFPKLLFRFVTTSELRRLKVEVATREAFSAGRTVDLPYEVASRFFTGKATVRTYSLEELLATKLRALYSARRVATSSISGTPRRSRPSTSSVCTPCSSSTGTRWAYSGSRVPKSTRTWPTNTSVSSLKTCFRSSRQGPPTFRTRATTGFERPSFRYSPASRSPSSS